LISLLKEEKVLAPNSAAAALADAASDAREKAEPSHT